MSRTVIAAVVAVIIAALTAIAFFISGSNLDKAQKADADAQLQRAFQVVNQLKQLEAIDIQNKVDRLAAQPEILGAMRQQNTQERERLATKAFQLFNSSEQTTARPDTIALLDAKGLVVALNDSPNIVAKQWLDSTETKSVLPAVNTVLGLPAADAAAKRRRIIISDVWVTKGADNVMKKVGVAPIIDPDEKADDKDGDGVHIIGAVVISYPQTPTLAQRDKQLLGIDVAYTETNSKIVVASFTKGNTTDEDTVRGKEVGALVGTLEASNKQKITIDGVDYLTSMEAMPTKATKALPDGYGLGPDKKPLVDAKIVVMSQVQTGGPATTVKVMILLVGIGALAISGLGLYLSHRRLIAQVDQVEQGVTDIINGNVDRTFRPVGEELDGLANGLNVMLARLLGRPEPGEEDFDEEGNPIVPGRVEFEEGDEQPSRTDPELAALAQESEPDYYKRVFTEYLSARKASGNPDDVSFENFIAKLKVNEGKLKAQYQCRAVRFRVVNKDGKVSLKPVPIFA